MRESNPWYEIGDSAPASYRRAGNEDNDQACMQMPEVRSDFAQIITPVVRAGRRSFPPLWELRALKTGPACPFRKKNPIVVTLPRAYPTREVVADKFLTRTRLVLLVARSFRSQVDTTRPVVWRR